MAGQGLFTSVATADVEWLWKALHRSGLSMDANRLLRQLKQPGAVGLFTLIRDLAQKLETQGAPNTQGLARSLRANMSTALQNLTPEYDVLLRPPAEQNSGAWEPGQVVGKDFDFGKAGWQAAPGFSLTQGGATSADVRGALAGLTPQELEQRFTVGSDPGFASRNLLRMFGIEPGRGNPMAEFMESQIAPLTRQADIYNAFASRGASAMQPREGQPAGSEALAALMGNVATKLGSGATNYLNPQEGRDFLQTISTMLGGTGGQTTLDQERYREYLKDPANAFNTLFSFMKGGMSPLLANSNVTNRVFENLFDRYRNSRDDGNANQSFFDYLRSFI